jgi:hypothetical protein
VNCGLCRIEQKGGRFQLFRSRVSRRYEEGGAKEAEVEIVDERE